MVARFHKWAFITPTRSRTMGDYYAGIMDFLKDRPDIILERLTYDEVNPEYFSQLSGIITYALPPKATLDRIDALNTVRPPVIAITMSDKLPDGFAAAHIDPFQVSERVVQKFLQRHCVSFGFCSCHTPYLTGESAQLLLAYRRAVWSHTGRMPRLFRPIVTTDPNLIPDEIKRFNEWLRAMPRPCGIFVHGDDVAKKVLDCCRISGIDVPRELRVIGTGNSPLYCERTHPSLSSFAVNHELAGYLAARALMALTHGSSPRSASFNVDVTDVVERASTSDEYGSGRIVAIVRKFIRQEIGRGVSPSIRDIAHHCNVSRAKLQNDFRATTGHSVHDELADYRLTVLAKSLRSSSEPVKVLAARAGLAVAQANRSFQARYGMTMTDYRREPIVQGKGRKALKSAKRRR